MNVTIKILRRVGANWKKRGWSNIPPRHSQQSDLNRPMRQAS